jgi:hypothetical protein
VLKPLNEADARGIVSHNAATQQHQNLYAPFHPHHPLPVQSHHPHVYDNISYVLGEAPLHPRLKHNPTPAALTALPPLLEDQLFLCVSQVHGFILKTKKWGK